MSAAEPDPRRTFPLRGRAAPIVLGEEGFHHPRSPSGSGHLYSRYADLTHVALTGRSLWIGTRSRTIALLRPLFATRDGAARLAAALFEQVARLPDGAARIARMRELDRMAREPHPAVATWTLAVLLHGFPLHLAMNALGLVFFGRLVERALGTPRTVVLMGVSQLVSMATAAVAHNGGVIGVSGVVAGLVGALLYMEMRLGSDLPAWWRLPRWLFVLLVAVILLQGLLDRLVPIVAAEAHLGGFAAGFTALALLMRAHRVHEAAGPRLRFA